MASVVVESSPPLISTTAGRGPARSSDTSPRPPHEDMQSRREPEPVAPTPLDHARQQGFLIVATHRPESRDQRDEARMLERLTPRHHDVGRCRLLDPAEQRLQAHRLTVPWIPRVLRVAPCAPDGAALQPDEDGGGSHRGTLALD